MKKHLERTMFMAAIAAVAVAGWLAVESAPPVAGPALVEVAVPASAPPAGAPEVQAPVAPRVEIDRDAALRAVDAEAPAVAGVAEFLQGARGETTPEPPVVPVAAQPPVVTEPAEQLATTDQPEEPIIVEHTVATIPDPPDVGSSERRETFEVDVETGTDDPWLGVRTCESHNNYAINTGNGFFGAYQFTISTWDWVAGLIGRPDLIGVRPDLAAPWDQDRMAQALAFEVDGGGLQHWPVCGRYYG